MTVTLICIRPGSRSKSDKNDFDRFQQVVVVTATIVFETAAMMMMVKKFRFPGL